MATEQKAVNIDFLDLGEALSRDEKAWALGKLSINRDLEFTFHGRKKYKKRTTHDWVERDVSVQLKSYVQAPRSES